MAATHSPRITLRFAVYSALALLLAGFAIFLVVRHELRKHAKEEVASRAERVALRADGYLSSGDLAGPVSNTRREQLDEAFHSDLRDGLVRIMVWNGSGTLVYSSGASLIGTGAAAPDELRQALAGAVVQKSSDVRATGETGPSFRAIETFVPLRTWSDLERRFPVLKSILPEVEALLVRRTSRHQDYFQLSIDHCYELSSLLRDAEAPASPELSMVQSFFARLDEQAGQRRHSRRPGA